MLRLAQGAAALAVGLPDAAHRHAAAGAQARVAVAAGFAPVAQPPLAGRFRGGGRIAPRDPQALRLRRLGRDPGDDRRRVERDEPPRRGAVAGRAARRFLPRAWRSRSISTRSGSPAAASTCSPACWSASWGSTVRSIRFRNWSPRPTSARENCDDGRHGRARRCFCSRQSPRPLGEGRGILSPLPLGEG